MDIVVEGWVRRGQQAEKNRKAGSPSWNVFRRQAAGAVASGPQRGWQRQRWRPRRCWRGGRQRRRWRRSEHQRDQIVPLRQRSRARRDLGGRCRHQGQRGPSHPHDALSLRRPQVWQRADALQHRRSGAPCACCTCARCPVRWVAPSLLLVFFFSLFIRLSPSGLWKNTNSAVAFVLFVLFYVEKCQSAR